MRLVINAEPDYLNIDAGPISITAVAASLVGHVVSATFVSGSLGVFRLFTAAAGIAVAFWLAFVLLDQQRTKLRPRARWGTVFLGAALLGATGWLLAPHIPHGQSPPRLTVSLASLQLPGSELHMIYRVRVHNAGPGRAEGVKVQVFGIEPYPSDTAFHGDFPYSLHMVEGQATEAAVNASDDVLYHLLGWHYGGTGAFLVEDLGGHPSSWELGSGVTLVVRIHVSSANADPSDTAVTISALANPLTVTLDSTPLGQK